MNNVKSPPIVPVTLDIFGGLYTEANPADVPPGASPLTINCDYLIGSVIQRAGLQNEYYYSSFFSEKNAGFGQSIASASGEAAWNNPNDISLNTPGTEASVTLNFSGSSGGAPAFDKQTTNGELTTPTVPWSVGPLTPSLGSEWALLLLNGGVPSNFDQAGWSAFAGANQLYGNLLGSGVAPFTASGEFPGGGGTWLGALLLFFTNGSAPVSAQVVDGSFQSPLGTIAVQFSGNTTAGNSLLVTIACLGSNPTAPVVSDDNGNTYTVIEFISPVVTGARTIFVALAQNINGGNHTTITVTHLADGSLNSPTVQVNEITNLVSPPSTNGLSQLLTATNFPFSIPSNLTPLGFQVEVSGNQSVSSADAQITIALINPTATSPTFQTQLPASDGQITVGTQSTTWGLAPLTPNLFNNPNFGVTVQASANEKVTFNIYSVKIKVWLTPNPPPSINYLKTFEQTSGQVLNMMLGSDGVFYQEEPLITPGALAGVYTAIQPNSFAQSATQDDLEFIAISNLQNGTDIPYTYDGTNFNRFSQVGPGAALAASTTSSASAIVSITQNGPVALLTGAHDWLLVSASPADHGTFGTPNTPGNVFTLIFRSATLVPSYITPGTNIVISGFPTINGNVVNNDPTGVTAPKFYTVTSVGQPIPGQQSYDAITFVVNFTTFYNQLTPPGCTIESTLATMTTAVQVPNLEVAGQFQVSGTGGAPPTGYDSSWTVLQTPNAAQMEITSTQLINNVATYAFVLITGTAPTVGQAVTVTLTLNGQGIFNVANAIITSATSGTFSINLSGPNISNASETGSGIVFGTIFVFDAFQVIGNKTGGNIVTTGIIAAGIRKICYSYLTNEGYLTQPSPIFTLDIVTGASAIAISKILPGPSNVIARVIHLTAANGGNFYNIPQPVTVNSNGTNVVNSSTYVLDNVSTSATLSFSDAVLLAATPIDVEGNNLFETVEVGSLLGVIPYASRMFAIFEQNKVTNFLNWSFDGGVQVVQSTTGATAGTTSTSPAGWTVDPTNGSGGSVPASPIFGFAYEINNTSGSTQSIYGMITQPAYQDEFQVPIIQASTAYSVRVTVSVPSGTSAPNILVVDLFSPSLNAAVGTFSLDLTTVNTTMGIFTGTLLTTVLAPVQTDLLLRLYTKSIPNNVTILIDRIEVFPTQQPNLGTIVTGSYASNFQALDQVTGIIDCGVQNQQPVRSAFVLNDLLHLVKTNSFVAVREIKGVEPVNWGTPRVISAVVGTPSIYGVTTGIDKANSGEEWAIIAGQSGAFIYNGGEPVKLSEEIQSLWNLINWQFGYTLWVQNDVANRRILFGVPLKTPNTWLPTGIIPDNSNPTTPNVIVELNYKQLNTAGALADRVGVHPAYTGKLISTDYARKWAIWTVGVPAAAFLTQADTTSALTLGNSQNNGKVYRLIDGLQQDDGAAIDQRYLPYAFPSSEQEESLGIGAIRKTFVFMRMLIDGNGPLEMTVYPNTLNSPYSHDLTPNINLPASTDGDVEIPVNETGDRLFVQFRTTQVGASFNLARLNLYMRGEPFAPVRGSNT